MIRVTVWNEFFHEKTEENVKAVYPDGLHRFIADFLSLEQDFDVRAVSLDMPEFGLPDEVLNSTDVLLWWGHCRHELVPNELAEKIKKRVLCGMGFIPLHSAHFSKPFVSLMGTTCSLSWRDGDVERVWNIFPSHPIAAGIGEYFELEHEEMYGERFDIPTPDELVFIGWFSGGEVFRSGCVWNRGLGKIFYFQPGHESNPTYHNKNVQTIIKNAVRYVAPLHIVDTIDCPHVPVSPEKKRIEALNA